jgi:hypothetical protein
MNSGNLVIAVPAKWRDSTASILWTLLLLAFDSSCCLLPQNNAAVSGAHVAASAFICGLIILSTQQQFCLQSEFQIVTDQTADRQQRCCGHKELATLLRTGPSTVLSIDY